MSRCLGFVLLVLASLLGKSLSSTTEKFENVTESSIKQSTNLTHNSTHTQLTNKSNFEDCIKREANLENLSPNQFLTILTKECRYDKLTSPKPSTGEPLIIRLHLNIRHIELLDQEVYKIDTLIRYRYIDHRLKFEHLSPKRDLLKGRDMIKQSIWVPHIVVANETEAKVMGLEGNDVFVSISSKGEVTYAYRGSIRLYCYMDFRKFPFDKQNCSLNFQSWLHNEDELLLIWDVEPVKLSQLRLTGFKLENTKATNSSMPPAIMTNDFDGNYSTLIFEFEVSREVGHYLMDYFIPSTLIVCTSWITFWLQADAGPPRATLGTSTLLSFITLASGQTRPLPKVPYIKISEIWFLGCVLFIFSSLVEFAFVNMIFRRKKNCELKKVNSKYVFKCTFAPSLARNELYKSMGSLNGDGSGLENVTIKSSNFDEPIMTRSSQNSIADSDAEMNNCEQTLWTTMTPPEVANWIDTRCRIAFPLAFLIFNLFFWSYTLSVSYFQ